MSWEFWIDRGGTFTDCIARGPDQRVHTAKILSSEDAPLRAIQTILARAAPDTPTIPEATVKLGTTVATNALLERRGVPTLLVASRGLSDVFAIGTQERPDLFALAISRPPPLHGQQLEIDARCDVKGAAPEPLDEDKLREALRQAHGRGARSVSIALMHAYAYPELESRVAAIARAAGFDYVACSHEVAEEIGYLARGETTLADAYLTPLLAAHTRVLADSLPGARLHFMQSSGGLTDAERFRGPTALLSGPAGGVIGAAHVARAAGHRDAIAFDMGGTSTDVSLIEDGEVERAFETEVGGVRVKAPMLRIHTVAAGGGSLCRFDGVRLSVGPESAGADPGPLCYGNPDATELALTDVNYWLGRLQADRFPLPLERAPVQRALSALAHAMETAGVPRSEDEIAAGFVEVANSHMTEAIKQVSVARGVDPRQHVLVGFGGAAGQHVCAIARQLGIESVLLHPFAGLLSAYGIGLADVTWDRQRDAGRQRLPDDGGLPADRVPLFEQLEAEGRRTLEAETADAREIRTERFLELRYAGTETALAISEPEDGNYRAAFEREHAARFGYTRKERAIEISTLRVRARALGAPPPEIADAVEGSRELCAARHAEAWFPALGRIEVPVYLREDLSRGRGIDGPALILEDTGTLVLDPGWSGSLNPDGTLVLSDRGASQRREVAAAADIRHGDPVQIEVFGSRFMSIAEQMGAVLRNTAVSTNIKERLDFSCAVFDRDGGLVANAPHIPVHLGAMGETVRCVRERIPDLVPGDVAVTNDPFAGGSHLPDVTVVTPVFDPEGSLDFFVASRGHHADLGGITPGSMPADSTRLEQEGVVIAPFRLVRAGRFDEARIRALLTSGEHPARNPDDNVADLEAMIAANRAGERLLAELVHKYGRSVVRDRMRELQRAAATKVAREIAKLADGDHAFRDQLDDGTPVCVRLRVAGERMDIDFEGTGAAVAGNLNAPPAVVQAAVIYVLRALVDEEIPLNGGCLVPVAIRVPAGCLLDPPPGSAVVGGNVETSQRVVDVLLGALGRAAASQGTMNNVTFGNAGFGYYETIGGGAGAGPGFDGASGVHTHMTNTRITDPELLESRYPVHLESFRLRAGSGGRGRHGGGCGLVRHYRFTEPVTVSLLTERRTTAPYGLEGGEPGAKGTNRVERADGKREEVPGKATLTLSRGDCLILETPGGGGYGTAF